MKGSQKGFITASCTRIVLLLLLFSHKLLSNTWSPWSHKGAGALGRSVKTNEKIPTGGSIAKIYPVVVYHSAWSRKGARRLSTIFSDGIAVGALHGKPPDFVPHRGFRP